MHGELIFSDPDTTTESRIPGNATIEDADTVLWEFHDRDLSDTEISQIMDALERLRAQGRAVELSYIPASPPLDEVESGPQVSDEHLKAVGYEVVGFDRDRTAVRLRRAGTAP